MVGSCGFAAPPRDGEAEIAYVTFPGHEGRGVAFQMASALMNLTREPAQAGGVQFIAHTLPQESPSTSILRKLGFTLLGNVEHEEDGQVMEAGAKWLTPRNPSYDMPTDQLPEQIETPRLLIRVAKPGDGPVFNEAVRGSLAELSPWLGWVSPAPSLEQSEFTCRRAYARYLLNEDLMVFFFDKATGALVGGSGLHGADWVNRKFEVGYWGRTGHGGRGLMTEGVRALADHALTELAAHRVFLTCDDQNTRSWQLAERAGFQLEGVMVNERLNLQGQVRDTRIYARTQASQANLRGCVNA